jgi:hypothetical protein
LEASQTSVHSVLSGTWRPFGCAEDLEVNFGTDDRPSLVTALLASCGDPRDDRYWWSQAVGRRTAALLRLVATTDAVEHLSLQAHCQVPECKEWFEFELPLALVIDQVPENAPVQVSLGNNRPVSLRCPSGQDLREWRKQRLASRQDAVTAMLESLVVDGQATLEDEPALAEALSAMDPLVAFMVSCACPSCAFPNKVRVNLEDIALTRLKQRQRALLHEIHKLASRYGWTEAEILAIPPRRRSCYLAMIEEE